MERKQLIIILVIIAVILSTLGYAILQAGL